MDWNHTSLQMGRNEWQTNEKRASNLQVRSLAGLLISLATFSFSMSVKLCFMIMAEGTKYKEEENIMRNAALNDWRFV